MTRFLMYSDWYYQQSRPVRWLVKLVEVTLLVILGLTAGLIIEAAT